MKSAHLGEHCREYDERVERPLGGNELGVMEA